MSFTSGAVILQEAEYSVELFVVGFFTLRPPKWACRKRANISLLKLLIADLAVMVGRSHSLMACSSECRVLVISGMVHMR